MTLPSLDRLRRNMDKLRKDAVEPPQERGYPFGYVSPELEKMYREWYERDPGAALGWRMRQPGFDFREAIRRCAAARQDRWTSEEVEERIEDGDERTESEDLDRQAETEPAILGKHDVHDSESREVTE